jgi:hypothetical protein
MQEGAFFNILVYFCIAYICKNAHPFVVPFIYSSQGCFFKKQNEMYFLRYFHLKLSYALMRINLIESIYVSKRENIYNISWLK